MDESNSIEKIENDFTKENNKQHSTVSSTSNKHCIILYNARETGCSSPPPMNEKNNSSDHRPRE